MLHVLHVKVNATFTWIKKFLFLIKNKVGIGDFTDINVRIVRIHKQASTNSLHAALFKISILGC